MVALNDDEFGHLPKPGIRETLSRGLNHVVAGITLGPEPGANIRSAEVHSRGQSYAEQAADKKAYPYHVRVYLAERARGNRDYREY